MGSADTRSDWYKLFTTQNAQLLRTHKTLQGFQNFESYRESLLKFINQAYRRNNEELISSVINLHRSIKFGLQITSDEVLSELIKLMPGIIGNKNKILPILGPLLVAPYTPDLTHTWTGDHGHRP